MDNLQTHLVLANAETEALLEELRQRLFTAQKAASMAERATSLSPIEDTGSRIRAERKKQGLTLNALCELSGVAYATLNKIEQGHDSARLDSVVSVARALGLKLWIG